MPGLALGITQLTITHPELLLAVPMKGLRTRPAIPVDLQDSRHLPGDPIGHQDFDRFGVVAIPPEDHDPHLVFDVGNPHRRREIPLPSISLPQFLAILRRDRGGQVAGLDDPTLPLQIAVSLQVADVASGPPEPVGLGMDVIEHLGAGEVTVHGEVAGMFRSQTQSINSQHSTVWLRNGCFRASQISCLRKRRNSSG